jgi:hypothetical protein
VRQTFKVIKQIYRKSAEPDGLQGLGIRFLCTAIFLLTSSRSWYRVAFTLYKHASIFKFFYRDSTRNYEIIRLRFFSRMLVMLTRSGISFPIPYEFNSNQVKVDKGILYCTTHLPLTKVGIKAMIENNYKVDRAIAANPTEEMNVAIWGMEEKIPALKTGPSVLLKTKSVLEQGMSVFVMIDYGSIENLSPNSLKMVHLSSSKAVFLFTKLRKSGVVQVWLEEAPFSGCTSDVEIQKNVNYLKAKSDQIIASYGS